MQANVGGMGCSHTQEISQVLIDVDRGSGAARFWRRCASCSRVAGLQPRQVEIKQTCLCVWIIRAAPPILPFAGYRTVVSSRELRLVVICSDVGWLLSASREARRFSIDPGPRYSHDSAVEGYVGPSTSSAAARSSRWRPWPTTAPAGSQYQSSFRQGPQPERTSASQKAERERCSLRRKMTTAARPGPSAAAAREGTPFTAARRRSLRDQYDEIR